MSNLPTYSFLPWARLGVANSITSADGDPKVILRAKIPVDLTLSADNVGGGSQTQDLHQDIQLYGPGDIVGIAKNAIVKNEPRDWITNFEPNKLPYVEFYDEDFPWRYTPAAPAGERLRPWLALVVLTEDEFDEITNLQGRPLPGFKLKAGMQAADLFPSPSELWAWAHVHVNQALGAPAAPALSQVLDTNPDFASARIVCPRKLAASTKYHAFLIPAFEAGRLIGIGAALPSDLVATASSWASGQIEFPSYHHWQFRTGLTGDFQYLVNLLKPQPVDKTVGVRDLDVLHPGAALPPIDQPPELKGVLELGGALRVPLATMAPADLAATQAFDQWDQKPYPHKFETALAKLVNQGDDLLGKAPAPGNPDPTVVPPLYGRWPSLTTRLMENRDGSAAGNQHNWVHALNLDPRFRVAAGLGTRVVQQNQEQLMNAAWQQVGEILEANALIRRAQLARSAALRLQARTFARMDPAPLLALTAPVHPRIVAGGATVRTAVKASLVPYAAMAPAFRRITRPRARLAARLGLSAPGKSTAVITQLASGAVVAAPPLAGPAGVLTGSNVQSGVNSKAAQASAQPGSSIKPGQVQLALQILSPAARTPATVATLPRSPTFVVAPPGQPHPPAAPAAAAAAQDSEEAARFKTALSDAFAMTASATSKPPTPLDVASVGKQVLAALDPAKTIPARCHATIGLPSRIKAAQAAETFTPAMAYPELDTPMYKPLADLSADLFLPNINRIPQNSLTLLETNQRFIESYLVGLNHEMARELLWREYPTDQRGSCFRQFWDVASVYTSHPPTAQEKEKLRDILPLDRWPRASELGQHNLREAGGDAALLVLVIRGELLKRYPTAVIYAQRAQWSTDAHGHIDTTKERTLVPLTDPEEDNPPPAKLRTPLWEARVDPDISFIGFNITADMAKGGTSGPNPDPGWFFVIHERPGEPQFGMNQPEPNAPLPRLINWDRVSWPHVGTKDNAIVHLDKTLTFTPYNANLDQEVMPNPNDAQAQWSPQTNAAQLAYILYRAPAMVAVHASRMLP